MQSACWRVWVCSTNCANTKSDLAAETVAAKIGMPPEQVFKTLLARGDRHGLCFAVVPANTELDLKALAAATGDRKMELVSVKELLA
jgi:Cys-tRNA(Pro)/Cys-tRNA(Cys) deacylase